MEQENKKLTYESFQLRLFKKIFENIEENKFVSSLAVLTEKETTKLIPLPGSLFEDKEDMDLTLRKISKLGNAKMCCFVSMCGISKVDKDENPEAFEKLKNLNVEKLTSEDIKLLQDSATIEEGLIFNFESIGEPSKVYAFVRNKEKSTFELKETFSSDDKEFEQERTGRFMNILEQ
jgi:hypothetical protein